MRNASALEVVAEPTISGVLSEAMDHLDTAERICATLRGQLFGEGEEGSDADERVHGNVESKARDACRRAASLVADLQSILNRI